MSFISKRIGCSKKEREKEKRKKKERSNQVLLKEFSKFPNKGRYVIPKGASVEVDPHHLSPLISFFCHHYLITHFIPLIHMHI
jgi:hypothetical protein